MDFGGALRRIARFLEPRGFRCAVVGGVGLAALGLPRTTLDLDLAVDSEAQEPLVAFMEGLGYETLYRSAGYSNHLHADPDLGRVDFVYVDPQTGSQLFEQSREVTGPDGLCVRVPRPEHLAAMKVAAMKSDRERTFQDLADIRFLLTLPGVDRAEIRAYFERQGLLERFDELAATL